MNVVALWMGWLSLPVLSPVLLQLFVGSGWVGLWLVGVTICSLRGCTALTLALDSGAAWLLGAPYPTTCCAVCCRVIPPFSLAVQLIEKQFQRGITDVRAVG